MSQSTYTAISKALKDSGYEKVWYEPYYVDKVRIGSRSLWISTQFRLTPVGMESALRSGDIGAALTDDHTAVEKAGVYTLKQIDKDLWLLTVIRNN